MDMLDIKFIQENKKIVEKAIADKKSEPVDLGILLGLYEDRKKLQGEISEINAGRNKAANDRNIEEGKKLKEKLKSLEEKLKKIDKEYVALMLKIPNVPHIAAPVGEGESDNKEIKTWGEKPEFGFEPKSHIELMTALDMVDFERGVKVHGFRGYFLKNDGAKLTWALWNYGRDFFLKKGFTEFIAPAICHKENFYGTGHLPGGAEVLYKTQDGDYLSGTAEVSAMGYFAGDVLKNLEDEPVKVLAFSPCFRREAGSYGKETKGLIRVHEFFKLEQIVLCEAKHETSVELHEWINRNYEEFLEGLGLPYRSVDASTGEMGQGKVRMYDVEGWLPSGNRYLELSSASYYHDFQTRRFNIKYKDKEGKTRLAHSLNSTAVATPRILAVLVENNQQEDGSVAIPKVLQKYMGREKIEN